MNIESILGNPILEKALFNKLTKLAKDRGLRSILITIDENGKFTPELFSEPMRCITETEFENLLKNQK